MLNVIITQIMTFTNSLNIKSKTKTPFSVLHTNIQSLSHNFDSLEKLPYRLKKKSVET